MIDEDKALRRYHNQVRFALLVDTIADQMRRKQYEIEDYIQAIHLAYQMTRPERLERGDDDGE